LDTMNSLLSFSLLLFPLLMNFGTLRKGRTYGKETSLLPLPHLSFNG